MKEFFCEGIAECRFYSWDLGEIEGGFCEGIYTVFIMSIF